MCDYWLVFLLGIYIGLLIGLTAGFLLGSYKLKKDSKALSPENDEAKPRDLSVGHQSNCIAEEKEDG